jgi:uncharacterized SAM-binding protein YcdF (DUF218 family)
MFFSLAEYLAQHWMVSDDIRPGDAIVVTGGALDVRPAAAARLFRQGIAPLVLVSKSDADAGREAIRMRERLLACGVPPDAIADFRIVLHSTYGEARGVADWARSFGLKRVIVPAEFFQTRRVQWIFRRELSRLRISVAVMAIFPPYYSVQNWWQTKLGRMNFRNELIKYAFYRLRY